MLTNQRLCWEGAPAAGEGTQEKDSAMGLPVSGLMGRGLVPGLSLASPLYLVWLRILLDGVHTSGQDGFQRRGSWEVGHLPPTGPSRILPVSLEGSPVVLIRASGYASGYCCARPRWAVLVNGPPAALGGVPWDRQGKENVMMAIAAVTGLITHNTSSPAATE